MWPRPRTSNDALSSRGRRLPLVGEDGHGGVAAGEADAVLDVGRPEDLVGLDALLEARREAVDEVDELARHLLAAAVPRPLGEIVGRVLAEHAEQVLAR